MALITRTFNFTDGTTAYGSQVETEIANIVNTVNNLDAGSTTWTNVKVTTLLPQADVNAGGHKVTNLGTPTLSGDALAYGGVLNGSTLTLSSTVNSNISFDSTSTHGIIGTTTNDSPAAGNVGEVISSSSATNNTFPTSGQYGDATSISLTAGDWMICAQLRTNANGATVSDVQLGISTTTGNSGTGLNSGDNLLDQSGTNAFTFYPVITIANYHVKLTTTTIHYLKVQATYIAATPVYQYRINAVRIR